MASTPRAFSSATCIHGVGFIAKFQARCACWRNDAGGALERQADEGNGNTVELSDFVRRKNRLAGRGLDRGSSQVVKLRARERVRSLTVVDRMAAAILHPLQLVLALVELVIADGGNRKPHHRKRLDRRLVVEHRR